MLLCKILNQFILFKSYIIKIIQALFLIQHYNDFFTQFSVLNSYFSASNFYFHLSIIYIQYFFPTSLKSGVHSYLVYFVTITTMCMSSHNIEFRTYGQRCCFLCSRLNQPSPVLMLSLQWISTTALYKIYQSWFPCHHCHLV